METAKEIVILPEIQNMLFPLKEEEMKALEESILKEGIRDPIVVWPQDGKYILIDGHNRYAIAQKYGLDFKIIEKNFKDLDEAREWIDLNQLGRRNLTDEARTIVLGRIYERARKRDENNRILISIEKKEKEKDINSLFDSPEKVGRQIVDHIEGNSIDINATESEDKTEESEVSNNQMSEEKINTRTSEVLAEMVGVSGRSVLRAAEFSRLFDRIKEKNPKVADRILRGEIVGAKSFLPPMAKKNEELFWKVIEKLEDPSIIRVDEALKLVKRENREQMIQKQVEDINNGRVIAPEGNFDVIVVDPPWPYGTEYDSEGRRAASPYPEMSLEEIKSIELPASDNCVLFLWTTHKFMRYSFDILDHWGFRDVAIITWVKDRIGLGTWLRSQSEFCIMAVKGKPIVNLTNQSTVIYGPLREHSRKPDEFYAMVDSLCIGRKLDYFAREKREGWEIFGTEVFKNE